MKNVPKLRFKEFTDEWKEKKLQEIFEISKAKYNPLKETKEYPCIELESLSQETGKVLKVFNSSEQKSIKNKFIKGEVLFGKLRPYLKKYLYSEFDGVCSSEIWVFNSKVNNNKFIYYFIQGENFIALSNTTSGTKMPRADWNLMKNESFYIPIFHEQEKIANFLSNVDKKISITEEKLNLFTEYKKGIMQKIFNQELRFKDENGNNYPEWEEKKLKDLTKSISNGISLNQNFDGIGYKVTRIETISSGKINLKKIGYITTDKNIDEYKLNIGDLLFSNINSVEHIGKIAYIDKNYDLYHGMNLLRIVFNKNLSSKYLYYVLTERKYKKLFEKLCNKAISQASINQTELGKIKVYIPCLEEQQKIADFLSAIDTKIEKISDELENLKLFKKGLLQKMFI